MELESAELAMRPTTRIEIEEADARQADAPDRHAGGHDDVQAVHANFDVDSEVLERVLASLRTVRRGSRDRAGAGPRGADAAADGSQEASAPRRRISTMVVVLGIDPGTAHTGYGVVVARGTKLAALDGGVIETAAGRPARAAPGAHPRAGVRPDRRAPAATRWRSRSSTSARTSRSAFAVGQARGVVLLAAGHGRAALLLLHAAAGQAGRLRIGPRGEGPGAADGRARCSRCPSRPSPTTPPTRWRWPSATPTAPR